MATLPQNMPVKKVLKIRLQYRLCTWRRCGQKISAMHVFTALGRLSSLGHTLQTPQYPQYLTLSLQGRLEPLPHQVLSSAALPE